MTAIRLSGSNYFRLYGTNKTTIGKWSTESSEDIFDYCNDLDCSNSDEHEYVFDGQVFFRKRLTEGVEHE